MKHINLFYPQWQGAGALTEMRSGAFELKETYLSSVPLSIVPIDQAPALKCRNGILGYDPLYYQMRYATRLLFEQKPSTIFTIGGGCDVEIAPISYLNDLLSGELTVLWLDAHGDLNTPASSPSNLFHGMPLRSLLGEGDESILSTQFSTLTPRQLVLIDPRALDEPESTYIYKHAVVAFSAEAVETDWMHLMDVIEKKGNRSIYVHLDLDVLDPALFPYTMCPVAGGIKPETLIEMLRCLNRRFDIVGLSLLEYIGGAGAYNDVLSEVVELGKNL